MMELLQLDEWLFRLINLDARHPWLDYLLPVWRNKYFWAPFYLFLLSFVAINFPRKALYWFIGLVLCITVGDTLSSQLIKKTVQRPRPCHTWQASEDIHLAVRCGAGYSFPSSHATTHFAAALFLILTLGRRFPWIRGPLLLWAASIALGQVYVGVHYPIDISVGALLGTLVGAGVARCYHQLGQPRGWTI